MRTAKEPMHDLKPISRKVGYNSINQVKTLSTRPTIDHPTEKEIITSHQYTFRISTTVQTAKVDVSIDGSNWVQCRESMGFWWFDWKNYTAKPYALHAKLLAKDGREHISALRRFIVKFTHNGKR